MIDLLTWNLAGLDDRRLDERTEAACLAMLLRPRPPDLVLLQEVVRRSWRAHLSHHFRAAGFVAVPPDPTDTDSEYAVALLVGPRLRVRSSVVAPLPATRMGRRLVGAALDTPLGPLRACTAHLESEREGARERRLQAAFVARWLADGEGPAVFAGDTNLRDAEAAEVAELAALTDAWEAAGRPDDHRFTWRAGRGPARARYDRVWVRDLAVTGFSLSGEVAPGLEGAPSDHLAVEVRLAPPA